MASVLQNFGAVVTEAISWMGDITEFATSDVLVLVFLAVPFVGLGIGLLKRMISL